MSMEALREAVRARLPSTGPGCRLVLCDLDADQVEAAIAEHDELAEEVDTLREVERLLNYRRECMESDVAGLRAIVGPLNRLRKAGAHVTVYPEGGGFASTLCDRPDCHITIMASLTDWKPTGYNGPTLADALVKACEALLGEEAT